MLKARSPPRALAKHRAISPPPPSRQGRLFPPCRGNPVTSLCATREDSLTTNAVAPPPPPPLPPTSTFPPAPLPPPPERLPIGGKWIHDQARRLSDDGAPRRIR